MAEKVWWNGEWLPTATALMIAATMLWLAGAPFDLSRARSATRPTLIEPSGALESFPRRFAWTAVEGALAYEVAVTALEPEEKLVFRQRGASTVLELTFDEGAEPGAGVYRWEVIALRGGAPGGKATAEFRVGSPVD